MKSCFFYAVYAMSKFSLYLIPINIIHQARRSLRSSTVSFSLIFIMLSAPSISYALNILVDFSSYDGSGFSPDPIPGMLDTDNWSVTGMSDGDVNFGGTCNTGDCARGSSSGEVDLGGCYAFDIGGKRIFGWQSTTSDFTPGSIVFRVMNDSGTTITQVSIGYEIWSLNNESRSSYLNFSYSSNGTGYTPVPSLNFNTPEAADASPQWSSVSRDVVIPGLNFEHGEFFYLRWESDDSSGTGARDELGIDNISVSDVPEPIPTISEWGMIIFLALLVGSAMWIIRVRKRQGSV